jgi:hypothetical protein
LPRSLDAVARTPVVARESEQYLKKVTIVRSIEEFVSNKSVMRYALTAHGLQDIAYAGAFVRKLLEGGVDQPDSLANRLVDPRYRSFVEAFNFKRYGEVTTSFDRTQKGTVDLYYWQQLESNAGEQNEGARLALYFNRKAPTVTSAYGLLADRALLQVTQTALGISPNTSNLSIDEQAKIISRKLDIIDLKDPQKLASLVRRFTVLWDLGNPGIGSQSNVTALFSGATSGLAVSSDTLASIQNLRTKR